MRTDISIRPYTLADLPGLITIQRECFPPPFPPELWWQPEQIASHVARFPAGALCAVAADGELVASATAMIVRDDPAHPEHTWAAISAEGWITTHDPTGDVLYGIDIAVRPAWRGQGVARALYAARFALVERLGLRAFRCGSRLSGFHHHAAEMPIEGYVAAVLAGRLTDPVVTPQLRAGMRAVHLLPGYLSDAEAHDFALLMEWPNPALAAKKAD
jgi:GNAT superfamily N-acetyltransferase